MESEYETYRYLHLRALAGWTKRRDELRKKEEAERKERDAQFPQSIAQFNAIPSMDVRVRVARFLVADRVEKERMCEQFGWAYRQVKQLEGDFERNVSGVSRWRRWVPPIAARARCCARWPARRGRGRVFGVRCDNGTDVPTQVVFQKDVRRSVREVEARDPQRKTS